MASEDIMARIARLEAENQRMAGELRSLREPPPPPPAAVIAPVGMVNAAAADPADPGLTMPQVQSEVRRLMWTKGDFRIVPYGWLWGNTVFSTARTNPGSFTLWVESATRQGEEECVVDGRNTRIGIDVLGPRIPFLNGAQTGGKVEIDFQGAFSISENKGGLLLRHAYAEVKNEDFRLLAGQTWDVTSPLLPGMLMYSVGWDGGNIGYRRAQFRAERYLAFSDVSLVTVQAAIAQNVFTDVISSFAMNTKAYAVRGETSPWPIVEGRLAWTLGERTGPDALPITFGVSGHVGQQEFDMIDTSTQFQNIILDDQRRNTWSFNTDLRVPITERFGAQCEFFMGENLGAFLGGVGQGIDVVTLQGIHSIGGWCEMWYDWGPRLHSHAGYSIDDPNDADLHYKGERRFNQFYWGNIIYDVTKQFLVGLEVSSWKTLYVNQAPGDAVRFEFVARYGF